ncbi:hypothetical protein [Streptomyces sp. NPDC006355]|uniref:hypothetical protein n=1 Tax=Streptomyces sp. NPDC006355 TaxID=3156758 RepID=UPI0033B9A402
MAKVVVSVVVEQEIDDGCDACWKKDETARQSVVEITLKGKTWFLCEEHEDKFAAQFVSIMGDPEGGK